MVNCSQLLWSLIVFIPLAPVLSAQDKESLQRGRFFDVLDGNGDGTVTRDEVVGPADAIQLIVGAKGSRLQLVLNTLYHVSQPIDNVPYSFYKEFIEYKDEKGKLVTGKYADFVRVAVPYCLGDRYREFRVVGTTRDLFDKVPYGREEDGTSRKCTFAQGKTFQQDEFFGAVVGSVVAEKSGLKIGDQLQLSHGNQDRHMHQQRFHVVGILDPTSTPSDRAVFVNMEGFFLLEDHARPVTDGNGKKTAKTTPTQARARKRAEALPEEQREVTAILLFTKTPIVSIGLANEINSGTIAQAASPMAEVSSALSGRDHMSLFFELARGVRVSEGKLDRKQFSSRSR